MRSASSMTPRARRSLTEPRGLNASIFTKRFTSGGESLPILTTGVFPIVSRMLSNLRPISARPFRLFGGTNVLVRGKLTHRDKRPLSRRAYSRASSTGWPWGVSR